MSPLQGGADRGQLCGAGQGHHAAHARGRGAQALPGWVAGAAAAALAFLLALLLWLLACCRHKAAALAAAVGFAAALDQASPLRDCWNLCASQIW